MLEVDTTKWKAVGETSNTKYFEVEPDILAAVPNKGSSDDGESARANQSFQNSYWHKAGHGGVVLVFFDRMISQDKDARRVYQKDLDLTVMRATALVGGSLIGRAMISFFLGISKPQCPVKPFGDVQGAIDWARQINREAEQRART
jgi:hypothetical protein